MRKLILLIALTTFSTLYGQNYQDLIKKADSCYTIKEYKISRDFYAKAFKIETKNSNTLYNGACSAALANDKKNAFNWLDLSIDNGYTNISHLKTDTDLTTLHAEKKWTQLTEKLQKKIDLAEANYDKPLQKELLDIYKEDQETRILYGAALKKYGHEGKVVDSLGKIILFKDSVNIIKVLKILDEKGWVGKDKVGPKANQTLFLVIQHSDLKIQQKYLPMMRDAVKKGNANPSALALLEDRIALGEGRKQIYGSQIATNPTTKTQYVQPLEDPDNVDKRRSEVGLGTLSEYVKNWNIVWDVEKYKKDLPEIEEMNKSNR
ncbi:MAG: DUF6624 domain-containing protein [Flavobacterium sp.]